MGEARCLSVMAGRVPAIPPPVAEAQIAGTRSAITRGRRPGAARPLAPARPHFHGGAQSAPRKIWRDVRSLGMSLSRLHQGFLPATIAATRSGSRLKTALAAVLRTGYIPIAEQEANHERAMAISDPGQSERRIRRTGPERSRQPRPQAADGYPEPAPRNAEMPTRRVQPVRCGGRTGRAGQIPTLQVDQGNARRSGKDGQAQPFIHAARPRP
jgi:hypothetical protein